MATMPPGGQVPVEPVKLPCGNPVECAEASAMIARIRGGEWRYISWCTSIHAPPGTLVEIAGYTEDMLIAYRHHLDGAHPPPTFDGVVYRPPPNVQTVINKPS